MNKPRFILMDIEGTTTDIEFVHRVLFPYSQELLADFVRRDGQEPEVAGAIQDTQKTVLNEDGLKINEEQAIGTLLRWISQDRKHTALKKLQGMIWREGYEQGAYRGHVYPDVPPALEQWKQAGIGLGIYSSGSVQAQKLLFGHSEVGDLTGYFSHYFDTNVGAKREVQSYKKIAEVLTLPPESILFLSDMEPELDAAQQAGFQTIQLVRPNTDESVKHPIAHNFSQIHFEL